MLIEKLASELAAVRDRMRSEVPLSASRDPITTLTPYTTPVPPTTAAPAARSAMLTAPAGMPAPPPSPGPMPYPYHRAFVGEEDATVLGGIIFEHRTYPVEELVLGDGPMEAPRGRMGPCVEIIPRTMALAPARPGQGPTHHIIRFGGIDYIDEEVRAHGVVREYVRRQRIDARAITHYPRRIRFRGRTYLRADTLLPR